MQGDPHVRFDEQGVETGRLVSPTGEPHDTAPLPDSTHPTGLDRIWSVRPLFYGNRRSMSMKPDILETLGRLYGQAARIPLGSGTAPDAILSATEGAWHSGDVRRLAKLARVAAETGDMADEVARAIERLAMKAH
jgi:hypothetical protein